MSLDVLPPELFNEIIKFYQFDSFCEFTRIATVNTSFRTFLSGEFSHLHAVLRESLFAKWMDEKMGYLPYQRIMEGLNSRHDELLNSERKLVRTQRNDLQIEGRLYGNSFSDYVFIHKIHFFSKLCCMFAELCRFHDVFWKSAFLAAFFSWSAFAIFYLCLYRSFESFLLYPYSICYHVFSILFIAEHYLRRLSIYIPGKFLGCIDAKHDTIDDIQRKLHSFGGGDAREWRNFQHKKPMFSLGGSLLVVLLSFVIFPLGAAKLDYFQVCFIVLAGSFIYSLLMLSQFADTFIIHIVNLIAHFILCYCVDSTSSFWPIRIINYAALALSLICIIDSFRRDVKVIVDIINSSPSGKGLVSKLLHFVYYPLATNTFWSAGISFFPRCYALLSLTISLRFFFNLTLPPFFPFSMLLIALVCIQLDIVMHGRNILGSFATESGDIFRAVKDALWALNLRYYLPRLLFC